MDISRQALGLSLALVAPVVFAQTAGSNTIQQDAWQLVQLANQARAEAGAGPLKWDQALALAARQHCLRMAADHSISHQYAGEPDVKARAAQAGAHFSLIEENVAFAQSPAAIHEAWMHSPEHRANLLNPQVDHVGVAVVAGRNGLYAVADYERVVPVLSQSQIEAQVAGLLHGIAILPDATQAHAACATEGAMPRPASGPRPHFAMFWEDAQLTKLPKSLVDALASGKYHQASVGSCSTQGEEGSFTAYRIAVLLY
ncbi:MAG: CAP domain-containing protein [Terracidiphilus sp.]